MFEDIKKQREIVRNNILKSFSNDIEKAHKVGDVHPNGKWVWTQLPSGKFDWRTKGGRAHQRSSASGGNGDTKPKQSQNASGEKTWDKIENFNKKGSVENDLWMTWYRFQNTGDPSRMSKFCQILEKKFPHVAEWNQTAPNTGKSIVTAKDENGNKIVSIDLSGDKIDLYKLQYFMDKCYENKLQRKTKDADTETKINKQTEKYSEMPIKDAKKALVGKIITISNNSFNGVKTCDSLGKITKVITYNKIPIATIEDAGGNTEDIKLSDLDVGWHSRHNDDYSKKNNIGKISIYDGDKWDSLLDKHHKQADKDFETNEANKPLLVDDLKVDDLKKCSIGTSVKIKGIAANTVDTYVKISKDKWKNKAVDGNKSDEEMLKKLKFYEHHPRISYSVNLSEIKSQIKS
jgi:hypothetical protein